VRVHFLGQFARQFDRLYLGAEGTAEDALDQAFDAGLEVAQDADLNRSLELGVASRSRETERES
jgi:hypothetical protein